MAELVGAFAASHAPLIAREWERLPPDVRETIASSFDEMGRRLAALKPDVLVMLSPDHWVNFFLDNLPSFCIGVGPEHDGPPEPFLAPVFPHKTLPGHKSPCSNAGPLVVGSGQAASRMAQVRDNGSSTAKGRAPNLLAKSSSCLGRKSSPAMSTR